MNTTVMANTTMFPTFNGTNVTTSATTNMTSTSMLTSSPTSTWTTGPFTTQTPAPTPIPGSLDTPWYFSDVLDLPALILYGIVGANLVLSFMAWFILKCCLHRPRSARRVRFVAPIVHFLIFFLFEFVVLCARLHAWTTNDNEYTPSWTAEGEMVFPGPAFSSSLSPDFLREVGCSDFILTNGTTSTLEPVGPSECSLGIRIGAKLSPGTVATISLVLGLMGFVLLEMFVLLLEMELERLKLKTLVMLPSLKAALKRDISVDDFNNSRDEDFEEEEQGGWCNWLKGFMVKLLYSVVFLVIASQQALVLFPLTNADFNDYCINLGKPPGISVRDLVCYHKYSLSGIPIGLPMLLGGRLLLKLANSCDEDETDIESVDGVINLVRLAMYIAGAILVVIGGILFGVWLVGGFIIGPWVHYTSWAQNRLLLLAEALAPALFTLITFVPECLSD
ncbi:hypothetical protein PTSG_04691 [Salpingoeca rosetta]|uniref:Uncharacterized protein n=2 Tax=Salpingoeca rosetta (strain ATCC 50818 / BSB-021) TaxID=946362 RepID=F2U855_SALR5|nr:uncharacterized protein PTSG_04691 [Salpingoeca rosetta]EGD72960.1 hypothetical protein PTSG_04691 [Salpingoeca rosetta]|eukprot:XP_004994782.1 hypothetical protein PTSG_04691 [Salpingoeca rosetta]